jgi:hypothetical protein
MRFSIIAIPFISTLLFQASALPIEKRESGRGTFFNPGYNSWEMGVDIADWAHVEAITGITT